MERPTVNEKKPKYLHHPIAVFLIAACFCGPYFAAEQTPYSEYDCDRKSATPSNWTPDVWAWHNRLCKGQAEVDFSEINDGNCNATKVSPEFIRGMLTYASMKRILDVY